MRNLKRVLSLALATVMLLGMMVVGAGAAEAKTETPAAKVAVTYDKLTDQADIVNKEAVSLMVDLGIIVGKPDGTFAPKEVVDRATMAKLITYIMMGDVDAGLFEGTVTDLKDIDKSWAKGYIKYCYANNIIAGDGKGNFLPTNGVTVAEASKMLLVAIGYDAKAQGYEGTSWSINVMRDAKIAGLLAGISAKTNDGLTRDNAAKMILNALSTPTVKYETQYDGGVAHKVNPTTKTNADNNATLGNLQYNLTKVDNKVLTGNAANGVTTAGKSVFDGTATLTIATKIEDLGKVMVYYTFNKDGKTVNSSFAAAKGNSKVVAVPTGLVMKKVETSDKLVSTWLSDNGLAEKAADKGTTALYTNYFKTDDIANAGVAAKLAVDKKQTAYVIDNGNDGVIDALVINGLVTKTVTGDVKTSTSGTKTTVTVPGVVAGYVDVANVYGYEGLVKGDVVFVMSINDKVTYITKAASVTGKITGSSSSKVMLDGTAYEKSPLVVEAFDTIKKFTDLAGTNYGNTVQLWLDANGKLVYGKISSGEVATTSAILLEVAANKTNFEGVTYQAKILKLDGTTEIVDVAKIYNMDDAKKADAAKDYVKEEYVFSAANPSQINFVKYSVDENGKYTMGVITNNDVDGKTTYTVDKGVKAADKVPAAGSLDGTAAITAGKANFAKALVGNANTTFINVEMANGKVTGFTVKTGIANAPAGTGVVGTALIANGISDIVFIHAGVPTSSGDGIFLYVSAKQFDARILNSDKTTSMKAYVDGVEQDVVVKNSVMDATIKAAGLYNVKMDGTTVTGAADTEAIGAADKVGVSQAGGVITVNATATAEYYTYTENTKVYVVDGKNVSVIAPADIVANTSDKVVVYGDATKLIAKTVIITKTELKFATGVTAVKYALDGAEAADLAVKTDLDGTGKATKNLVITATVAKGYKATVTVTGNGTAVTAASTDAKSGSVVATYAINADDIAGVDQVKVVVLVSNGETETSTTYTVDLKAAK